MKIAVVGAGIFGCTAALKLDPIGSVDLFDELPDILGRASRCNQYRLHMGYHYPRSKETILQSMKGVESFTSEYGGCLGYDWNQHYYAIANSGSITNANDYLKFLDDNGLEYQIASDEVDWIQNVDMLIEVPERTINYRLLKETVSKRLDRSKINLKLNTRFEIGQIDDYDVVINATYSNVNYLLPDSDRIDYQFEICEKPVVSLGDSFDRRSVVIMDGPFMCLDPYNQGSGQFWQPKYCDHHVLGHVEHAIHHRNIGTFPEIPPDMIGYIDSTIRSHREITNIDRFKSAFTHFFPNVNINYFGSMYTVRTVLPNRDHDDARPSYITKHSDKLYSIFSGKIGTCVDIAKELKEMIS